MSGASPGDTARDDKVTYATVSHGRGRSGAQSVTSMASIAIPMDRRHACDSSGRSPQPRVRGAAERHRVAGHRRDRQQPGPGAQHVPDEVDQERPRDQRNAGTAAVPVVPGEAAIAAAM